MYLQFQCPPLPYFVVAGQTLFRAGDVHERRILKNVFDLILVTQGRLYLQDEADKYSLGKNDYVILAPNRLHYGFRPCEEDTRIAWLHFAAAGNVDRVRQPKIEIRKKANRRKYYSKDIFNLYLPVYKRLSEKDQQYLIQNMVNLSDVDVNHKLREKRFSRPQIDQLVEQQLFLNIIAAIYVQSSISPQDSLATQVYNFIESHYDHPFSLTEISQRFLYSKPYIINSVKQAYGQTPQQLHRQIRLEKAERMLIESTQSIDEISEKLGYASSSYFIKQFKSRYHQTPLAYRHHSN
ncbi:hypothetical protein YK48G_08840 [Lentilactobacillus fungorum]|uniref:HTH araC/xylS-type domain-containing protein n=1 Tax=Lentilactobacillus fungorum TaxID=2201250 RepID=A0ABQ3VZY6_9LACO|nr:AraC family transcriptional regulator [Lentilactobacillus fungorum]GHP13459.1 hypothetical protein YK48G_08840 [Lentilactobacillus fungorum]